MKVAVNIHCLHPPLTGIGHYARHLLQAMLADPGVESVVGVSHAGWHEQQELAAILAQDSGYDPQPAAAAAGGNRVLGFGRRVLRRVPGMGRLRARLNYLRQQRETRGYRDHIYWEPNYLLLPLENPALLTVHDLSHLRYPQFHPAERLRELARLPDCLRRARRVAVVSAFSGAELVELCGLDPDKIERVPPAVSGDFRPREPADCEALRQRYELPEQFVLYAGTIEPRKNLPRLLAGYMALPEALRRDYPLVLAGGDGWHHEEFDAALAAIETPTVRRLGYVPAADLPVLYNAATIFAYPSLYEGFGMPVLEAMASGVPVLTANAASMPEVAAGAARLVDPLSVAEIGAGLQVLLEDADQRQRLRALGLEVAAGHSWDRSYRRLRDALRAVA